MTQVPNICLLTHTHTHKHTHTLNTARSVSTTTDNITTAQVNTKNVNRHIEKYTSHEMALFDIYQGYHLSCNILLSHVTQVTY